MKAQRAEIAELEREHELLRRKNAELKAKLLRLLRDKAIRTAIDEARQTEMLKHNVASFVGRRVRETKYDFGEGARGQLTISDKQVRNILKKIWK